MGKQEFLALECFSCHMFQSVIKNKKSQFECKICHEKQSVRKIYAISDNAKGISTDFIQDVRNVVQSLNTNTEYQPEVSEAKPITDLKELTIQESKWDQFVELQPNSPTSEEEDPSLTTVDPKSAKKKRKVSERPRPEKKTKKEHTIIDSEPEKHIRVPREVSDPPIPLPRQTSASHSLRSQSENQPTTSKPSNSSKWSKYKAQDLSDSE